MISVCIATFNGERYLKEELESILPQLGVNDEIIVSDDGSTDETLSILKTLDDPRIRVYNHRKAKAKFRFDYTTHNFENALLHAKGDYIFLADQDDVWLPEKCKLMLEALEHADIVVSNCTVVDRNLNVTKPLLYNKKHKRSSKVLKNIINPENTGCCMAFKRKVLDRILPFPKYGVAQDVWIAVCGNIYYKLVYLPQPLILFRRHDNNVSSSASKSTDSIFYKLSYRWYTLCGLIRKVGILKVMQNFV